MNESYIKKLEDTNKALEEENKRLQEAMVAYNILQRHLGATLNYCRELIYTNLKDSPKRNEKADREFKNVLAALQKEVFENKPIDIDSFTVSTWDEIKKHIKMTEKKCLEVFKKTV